MPAVTWDGGDLLLAVHVLPRAKRDEVLGVLGDRLKIKITAPPVDGQANRHLTGVLAELFGVPRRDVLLLSGQTGRDKRFRIVAPQRRPDFITAGTAATG